jgi:S-adenosyl-L-methionine hydrolase (adenosine-forming)
MLTRLPDAEVATPANMNAPMADSAPVITFLSDYGLEDDFVGICHGVIASLCPQARVIDLTHGVSRQDVRRGALILKEALPYMPTGVHLAVVDPDVGAQRRAVALRLADDRILVGPDNGLLSPAAEDAGGVVEAVDIVRSKFRLEPVSATFHGRDIFAPVAAALARGVPLAETGSPCGPDELVRLALPQPHIGGAELRLHAIYIDRYGNVALNVEHAQLAELGFRLGAPVAVGAGEHDLGASYVRTFADVKPGELMLYEDAYRRLSLAVSYGSAAELLGLKLDDEVRIRT